MKNHLKVCQGEMAPVCQESLDGNTETQGLNAGFWCLKKIKSHNHQIAHYWKREGLRGTATALSDKGKGNDEKASCKPVTLSCLGALNSLSKNKVSLLHPFKTSKRAFLCTAANMNGS